MKFKGLFKVVLMSFLLFVFLALPLNNSFAQDSIKASSKKITLDKKEITLVVGGKEQLTATITPEDGENKELKWESLDGNIAVVDQNGVVRAFNKGKCTILVMTRDGDCVDACRVDVVEDTFPNEGYEEWSGESNSAEVSPTKEWKIKFNTPINKSDLEQNIFIMDKNSGKKVLIDLSVSLDNKVVTVGHSEPFKNGNEYILYVKKDVKNNLDKTLKTGIKMYFSVSM